MNNYPVFATINVTAFYYITGAAVARMQRQSMSNKVENLSRTALSVITYVTPANIRRAFVFLYKFYIRRRTNVAENIRDF